MHEAEDDPMFEAHEHDETEALITVRDWVRYAVTRLESEEAFYGHGCEDVLDEAVWLVSGASGLRCGAGASSPGAAARGAWRGMA